MKAERALENAVKHNPSWISLWTHSEKELFPGIEVAAVDCPYHGTAYRDVPGYVSGYGCPVCKGIGESHVKVVAISPELLREAYNEAWTAGHNQGRMDGIRECAKGGGEGFGP